MILPASALPEKTGTFTNTDRRVQLARRALDPPGQARQDLDIIQEMARRLGLDWQYHDTAAVYEEMRQAISALGGISWARIESQDSVTYPCWTEDDPGRPVVFQKNFPTADGIGRFVPRASDSRRRIARYRVSVCADYRPPTRTLAYRRNDPPGERPQRHRTAARD